jgi:hypothetical protein
MRNKLTVLAFILFVASSAHSQDWSGKYRIYQQYPGYIITLKGDTLNGFIVHGNKTDNQTSVSYFAEENNSKTMKTYKPGELKGYKVADKEYRAINWSGGLAKNPLNFVLVTKPGRITQFAYYLSNSNEESETQMVWMREGEAPIQHTDFVLGFAKKMSKLVSDYPELAKKVEDKEKGYGLMRVFQIIDEYNAWWAAKSK